MLPTWGSFDLSGRVMTKSLRQDNKAADQFATRRALAQSLGGHLPPPGTKVGLLGGSFNPAHGGHLQISLEALRRLGLQEVWWLVSPQNPLKPNSGMAPLETRLESARRLARHPRIFVGDPERLLKTRYSVDSLAVLRRRLPAIEFVWLMGADNLEQLERWHRWQQIFHMLPVAIFDRPSYSLRALAGRASRIFAAYRKPECRARALVAEGAPGWVFLHIRLNPLSASSLRAASGEVPASHG